MALFDIFKRKKKDKVKDVKTNDTIKKEEEVKEKPVAEKPEEPQKKQEVPVNAKPKPMPSKQETEKAPAKVSQPVAKEAKTVAKPEEKASPKKSETKSAPVPAQKNETKSAPKTEPKPEAKLTQKPAPKAETKTEAVKEEKAEAVADTKGYTGRFEINKSKDGKKFFFNLYASNKVGIATSQMYSTAQSALTGIKSVIANAAEAPIEDQTLKKYDTLPFPKWEIYVDNGGKYRFRLNASNGSCICYSQGYTTKTACKNGIDSIIRSSRNPEIDKTYINK